jgi:hypothetical protein
MKTASRVLPKISLRRLGVAAAASGAIALTAALTLAGPASASASTSTSTSTSNATGYQFHTLNNDRDLTFNQLLGINNNGVIAGYFGSGAKGHPNKGYRLFFPYGQGSYFNDNFPGSKQTQVTGLNDHGVIVGFWSTQNNSNMVNNNFGFYSIDGRFYTVNFPTGNNASPQVDQLLGVNDHDVAVGFYTNAQGNNRGYLYNIRTRTFTRVLVPGAPAGQAGPSLTAAAINNYGDVAGFYAKSSSQTDAFLRLHDGRFITLAVPGASMTQAFGVNDRDEIVGAYTVGTGSNAVMHGFTWRPGYGLRTVDDPHGVGTTTINGVNDAGDLVGFYVDSAGNTDGMLALPRG